ncbi:hypothetical protein TBLA_0B07940 [Henningerozyma blattae CBS 6284]|uniref:Nucleolar protein 19 n=1 Tax=Henningerozyma blattae (strain ATCC 34711 / CBS 6284 / DSM 70876 / NBRC 10599 / NRRL Y-10934 / UCD 77-7) TaxID=1071380 RepID=I2GZQ8_HENB6|nr:hypothetical protein TBLA_0B07940 [Tetrapisispora blattae CBS 6284]CCH59610.1 hypothetical protein TBLA_0B07940 [Tetrapisispora blattae CBS 6284]
MSRAKEIQEKLALQAKLQVTFNTNQSIILNWLGDENGDNEKVNQDFKELSESKDQFFKLPVIQHGTGLGVVDNSVDKNDNLDIHTIGDFISSNKKVSTLSKKKKRDPADSSNSHGNNIYRIAKNDTTAMVALKRKMRTTERINSKKNSDTRSNSKFMNAKVIEVRHNEENTDDSSDEDEKSNPRAAKKTFGLLFNSKKKK